MVGFSSTSLFLARKREAVTLDGTRRIDHLPRRRTQEPVSSKAGETSETRAAFQIHSRKTIITRAQAP